VNGKPRAISAISVLMDRVKALDEDASTSSSPKDTDFINAVRALTLLVDTCTWALAEIDHPSNAVEGFEHLDFLARVRIAHRMRTILGIVNHLDVLEEHDMPG